MVRSNNIIILICLVLLNATVLTQDQGIDGKRSEHQKLKNEIQEIEEELKQSSNREKQSLLAYDKLNRQNFLINKVVLNLRREEDSKEKEIRLSEMKITSLENDIDKLKKNYARYIKAIYKKGKVNEWEALLNSNSFRQAVLRYKYLKEFSRQRKKDMDRFMLNISELTNARIQLEEERLEKKKLADEKRNEEKILSAKLTEQKKILDNVRKNKTVLASKLKEKQNAEKQIAD